MHPPSLVRAKGGLSSRAHLLFLLRCSQALICFTQGKLPGHRVPLLPPEGVGWTMAWTLSLVQPERVERLPMTSHDWSGVLPPVVFPFILVLEIELGGGSWFLFPLLDPQVRGSLLQLPSPPLPLAARPSSESIPQSDVPGAGSLQRSSCPRVPQLPLPSWCSMFRSP